MQNKINETATGATVAASKSKTPTDQSSVSEETTVPPPVGGGNSENGTSTASQSGPPPVVLGEKVVYMPIERLTPHPTNIKVYGNAVEPKFVEAVKENGIYDPILITPNADLNNCHRIISGHRRHEAAKQAGFTEVPTILFEKTDETEILLALLEANRQRVKTNEQLAREYMLFLEVEAAKAAKRQATSVAGKGKKTFAEDESGKARDIAASFVGWSGPTAAKALKVIQTVDSYREKDKTKKADRAIEALNKSVESGHRVVARKPKKKKSVQSSGAVPNDQGAKCFDAVKAKLEDAQRGLEATGATLLETEGTELRNLLQRLGELVNELLHDRVEEAA